MASTPFILNHSNNLLSQDPPKSNTELLLLRLSKFEEEARYYRSKFQEVKSINQSIITAIKRVYSQEVGEELEKIVQQQQKGFSDSRGQTNQDDLTDTFYQKIKTWGSKLISEQSIDQLPFKSLTPKKNDSLLGGSMIKNGAKLNITPLLCKSSSRKYPCQESPLKGDYQMSTRRTSTPLRSQIATEIYCELCEKVFPPNQFVNHAQRCKYQVEYIEAENSGMFFQGGQAKTWSLNYDKMMKNLMKIRNEIEQQIYMISATRQDLDRANLRKKLQKDLKKVMKVINQKQEQRRGKKVPTSKGSKSGATRRGSKI